jgi:hypothetical protein
MWLRIRTRALNEHGNEPSVSVKFKEVVEYTDWRLLNKGSAQRNWTEEKLFYMYISLLFVTN